jgi:ribonuclease G
MALTILQRVKEYITGKKDVRTGTRLVVNCERLENRVALLEDGQLEEFNIERVGTNSIIGSIYKGKVKNIESGLKAMFIDIGFEKNAFLHLWDAIPEAISANKGMEEITRGKPSKHRKNIQASDIPNIYPIGSEIMVQVTKAGVGNKGPRVTTNISLAGRLIVLMPQNEQFGISRKVEDPKERTRLRKIVEEISIPDGMGMILRTEASGKRARHIIRDLHYLLDQWNQIVNIRENKDSPVCCFQEPDLIERTVRDFLTEDIDEVACDNIETVQRMQSMTALISKRAKRRINVYQNPTPIFDFYGIQRQIENAFYREVWMPCGGYIVIDQTEALISIDVNTGRNKGAKDVDRVILETNLEAAAEVSRQLRLRNMGGLIVVDFIDMKNRKDQQAVYKAMLEHLKRDKAKTQILPISQFGLMEMTRQRITESLNSALYEPCPHCKGHGQIKTVTTMSIEIQRRLNFILGKIQHSDDKNLNIVVHPEVLNRLRSEDGEHLIEIQRRYNTVFSFRADSNISRDEFKIYYQHSGEEVRV